MKTRLAFSDFLSKCFRSVAMILCLFAATVLMTGTAQAQNAPVKLTVSAAASLTDAFNEIKALFEAAHPNVTVATNYAASGPLLRQIEMGAPVDVFASADEFTMDKGSASKVIIDDKRVTFTANSLVLIAPFSGKDQSAPAADFLTSADTKRIAIGSPDSVPVGRYAKASLESMKLWDTLAPKFVMAANVRQVLDYVSRGEVDAGIVYATDANLGLKSQKIGMVATLTGHKPITYPIAPCINPAASPEQAAFAQAFVDFVMSAEGQGVLANYGFGK